MNLILVVTNALQNLMIIDEGWKLEDDASELGESYGLGS
jgi:hypothetical protein